MQSTTFWQPSGRLGTGEMWWKFRWRFQVSFPDHEVQWVWAEGNWEWFWGQLWWSWVWWFLWRSWLKWLWRFRPRSWLVTPKLLGDKRSPWLLQHHVSYQLLLMDDLKLHLSSFFTPNICISYPFIRFFLTSFNLYIVVGVALISKCANFLSLSADRSSEVSVRNFRKELIHFIIHRLQFSLIPLHRFELLALVG